MTLPPAITDDTDPKALAVQTEILRRMPPWRKMQLVVEACRAADAMTLAGLRRRHPEASEDELRLRRIHLSLGDALFETVYGRAIDYRP